MPKIASLSLRISGALRKELDRVAANERRSVSQVCEALLEGGLDAYKKEGTPYLHRYLGRERK
jgi:hypothetical protein